MGLPLDLLKTRLKNEMVVCSRYLRHAIEMDEISSSPFPVEIKVDMKEIPALELSEEGLRKREDHRFSIIINEEYPFEKPLVIWRTPIFHPNIMIPEDGGHVCIKLLDDWNLNSTVLSFIKGIEAMLMNPNPLSPFGTESCTRAAEYFNSSGTRGPPIIHKPSVKIVRRS